MKDIKTEGMSKKKKIIMVVLAFLILSGLGYFYYQGMKEPEKSKLYQIFKKPEPSEKKTICPLDGLLVKEEVSNRHPLAIMIENHLDARPQSGLSLASLIYEAIAEGGITRFMALYVWGEPEKVGPVRSARTYDLDWLSEFNAFYAHVGGNYTALQQIKQYGILDLDQFRYGKRAYWREYTKGKATEHTMYTSPKKLWELAKKNGWEMKGNYLSFDFKDDLELSQRPESASVTIDFSQPNYKVVWQYDRETNSYKRLQAGLPAKDILSGKQLEAKNIILQWVKRRQVVSVIGEKSWDYETIGSGKAKVFRDGKAIEGTWKKDSRDSRTWFYDQNGFKIQFNRGQTWIEIVHPEISVKIE